MQPGVVDVAQARARLDWTRRQLADTLRVSVASLARYEKGIVAFPVNKVPVLQKLLGGDVPEQPGIVEVGGVPDGTGLQRDFTVFRRRAKVGHGMVAPDGRTVVCWINPPYVETHPSLEQFQHSRERGDGYSMVFRDRNKF